MTFNPTAPSSRPEIKVASLGYPRIGRHRELKRAVEAYWKGELLSLPLEAEARRIRRERWQDQKKAGVDILPSNDFSLYDHVLDHSILVGAIPERFAALRWDSPLELLFAMARGLSEKDRAKGISIPAMEMTKWFDTNYHYLVPEFRKSTRFKLASEKPFSEFLEAKEMGWETRPVLLGPLSYLFLGKFKEDRGSVLDLLGSLVGVYQAIFERFKALGATTLQIDEPILAMDLNSDIRKAFENGYRDLGASAKGLSLILTPAFGPLGPHWDLVLSLPVQGLHLDLTQKEEDLNRLKEIPKDWVISLGIVDGRNVWKSDLSKCLKKLEGILTSSQPEQVILAPSCSLLHVPIDLKLEAQLDPVIKSSLAFALQKIEELRLLKIALEKGSKAVQKELEENQAALKQQESDSRRFRSDVRNRLKSITAKDLRRKNPYPVRRLLQRTRCALPLFPTTTIGSFPQTFDVRQARARMKNRTMTEQAYQDLLREKIREAIRLQEEIGLDVLVHGEFERPDMVEYFGERLDGFAFTQHGWVQSYGTRIVKPPILYGDVSRPGSLTVDWIRYAQSLTPKPVKGMLTGPVTILQWSFLRDDQPREESARQIALAIRDEVLDLEKAGIGIIQIDEPAIREGLPLRRSQWDAYLGWAVECFQIASSGVQDTTQIHTHMCYSEFRDILSAITRMDADVISIESSRSQMELLDAFAEFRFPHQIGPGVYDIHSPQIPGDEEIIERLKKAARVLEPDAIWVNPDCGLKTRNWEETIPSLQSMVRAAKFMREKAAQNTRSLKNDPSAFRA